MGTPRKVPRIDLDNGVVGMAGEMDGEDDGQVNFEEYPVELQQISHMQELLDELANQMNEEIKAVEERYRKEKEALYVQRAESARQLPGFWGATLANCTDMGWSEADVDLLQYVRDLSIEDTPSSLTVKMTIQPNPYMGNTVLSKTYSRLDNVLTAQHTTTVDWLDDKGAEAANGKKRTRQAESIFDWFSQLTTDPLADFVLDILVGVWEDPLRFYLSSTTEENDVEEINEESDQIEGDESFLDDLPAEGLDEYGQSAADDDVDESNEELEGEGEMKGDGAEEERGEEGEVEHAYHNERGESMSNMTTAMTGLAASSEAPEEVWSVTPGPLP